MRRRMQCFHNSEFKDPPTGKRAHGIRIVISQDECLWINDFVANPIEFGGGRRSHGPHPLVDYATLTTQAESVCGIRLQAKRRPRGC